MIFILCSQDENFVSVVTKSQRANKSQIHGRQKNTLRTIKYGLSQGLVKAPALFNLCIYDQSNTSSFKLLHADDYGTGIPKQRNDNRVGSATVDLNKINTNLYEWKLDPNPFNTEVCAFHL